MADNTEEQTQAADGSGPADAENSELLSGDAGFTYWLIMLPFLAIAGVFIFEFSKHPGEYNRLVNAAGAVVVGIFVASFANILSEGNKQEDAGNAESPKPEGSA